MRDTELNRAFKYFADDVVEVMNGELDGKADLVDGKVPSTQLPSYVDDTVEGYYYDGKFYEDAQHTTEITGETGKIYIDISSNKSYRWTGSVYTRIDECPAFGETQGTIYEGNKGKANADAIGTLSNLTTTDRSSLVAAINELNSGKAENVSNHLWTQDLSAITTNSFIVYNNSATDSPVSGSYGFCRTSVFDSNSMLQEVTLISEPYGDSYVRVKAGGTWQAWKKTTND